MKTQKRYPKEVRERAVRLVIEQGKRDGVTSSERDRVKQLEESAKVA